MSVGRDCSRRRLLADSHASATGSQPSSVDAAHCKRGMHGAADWRRTCRPPRPSRPVRVLGTGVYTPQAVPLPLIQVLLPHLRVSRGVSGLARSARAQHTRQRFYETATGIPPRESTIPHALGRASMLPHLRVKTSVMSSHPSASSGGPLAGPNHTLEYVDSVNTPRNAVNVPLRLFRQNPSSYVFVPTQRLRAYS